MKVELISLTQAINTPMTPEELIVYIARVSNPANRDKDGVKLIKYLIDNKHWSPFEMVDMTVEIVTSRAIAAQILRHRSFSFQEFSQRYSKATELEPVSIRMQAQTNRQSSTEEFDPEVYTAQETIDGHPRKASEVIEGAMSIISHIYEDLLKVGVAKEVARMILPLTTQTTLYMKGSVRSWIHYLAVRDDEHAQLEHQLIAKEIKSIFKTQFPLIYENLQFA